MMSSMLLKLFSFGLLASSTPIAVASPLEKRAVAYTNPTSNGGSMLDSSAGLGEPLNVIVSGLSSASVLTSSGIVAWINSLSYAVSCLGIESGDDQTANTGDGQGWVGDLGVYRYDYGFTGLGSCLETLTGGNHLRLWQQKTTGAYFLAVSYEEDLNNSHTVEPNGYDIGRDDLVSAATSAKTTYNGVTYTTTSTYVTGLLTPGSAGINHNITIDGRVAVLTVKAS